MMEQPDQHRAGENVTIHGLLHVIAARTFLQVKLGIQCEELEGVMVRRSWRRAGSKEHGLTRDIGRLDAHR